MVFVDNCLWIFERCANIRFVRILLCFLFCFISCFVYSYYVVEALVAITKQSYILCMHTWRWKTLVLLSPVQLRIHHFISFMDRSFYIQHSSGWVSAWFLGWFYYDQFWSKVSTRLFSSLRHHICSMYGDGPIHRQVLLSQQRYLQPLQYVGRQEYIQKSLQQVEHVFVIFYACPFKLWIGRL